MSERHGLLFMLLTSSSAHHFSSGSFNIVMEGVGIRIRFKKIFIYLFIYLLIFNVTIAAIIVFLGI